MRKTLLHGSALLMALAASNALHAQDVGVAWQGQSGMSSNPTSQTISINRFWKHPMAAMPLDR